jgi:Sulfate permease family
MATATNFASRRGDEVDPDQEMVGIGTSNIAAGFFQGFAVGVSGCAQPWLTSLEPGLNTTLDREHSCPSLDQALDAINNGAVDSPMPPDEGMPPP